MKIGDGIKYHIAKAALSILSYLPLSLIQLIGRSIGLIGYKVAKKQRLRMINNLLVTGVCDQTQVEMMAKATAVELGKTLVETMTIAWQRSKMQNSKLIKTVNNWNLVEKAYNDNRGIVFLTPHIGNFEIGLKYTANRLNRQFKVLYKSTKKQWWNSLMCEGRKEDNITPVAIGAKGVGGIVRSLKEGGMVGILPDNVASKGSGEWVKFFNKEMFATTLAAKLTLLENVQTFVVSVIRIGDGFTLSFIPYSPSCNDIKIVVQEILTIIEMFVTKNPTQFYWSYDRFRVPDHARNIK